MTLIDIVLETPPQRLAAQLADTPSLAQFRFDKEWFEPAIGHQIYREDTLLHAAAAASRVEAATLLLNSGAEVNAQNRNGARPLDYACDLRTGIDGSRTDAMRRTIEALISCGAAVDAPDKLGVRPLHRAVRGRNVIAVELLLGCGADPNAPKGRAGSTPLHLAVVSSGASSTADNVDAQVAIVGHLVRAGAKMDGVDGRGRTVRDVLRGPRLCGVLVRRGLLP